MTGLCPLIPIPLLDDWVRDLLRRRLSRELARLHEVELSDSEVKLLACGQRQLSVEGCLRGCFVAAVIRPLVKVVIKVLQKLFRKILIFLMVKDSVDTFSQTFHEAYLQRHAFASGSLPKAPAAEVRQAIEVVVAETDPRPVEQLVRRTFRTSWRLIKHGAAQLTRLTRSLHRAHGDDETPVHELDLSGEEEVLGAVVDELTEELEAESPYLNRLEKSFDEHMHCQGSSSI